MLDRQPRPTPVDEAVQEPPGAAEASPGAARVPWSVYAAAAVAALLRAVPFLRTRLEAPPPGRAWIDAPYVPEDWFAYLGLIREQPRAGQLLLANPYTTEPQDGRFVLLFHQALHAIHRATHVDPAILLEIARPALILLFAVVLWRFLEGFYGSARTRSWAVGLVLLSGGVDFAARWAARWLPEHAAGVLRQDLWTMFGWTTFHSLYNPLWVLGFVLLLVALRPLLQPGGPASARDVARSAAAFVALFLVHAYSAIAAVAIACAALAGEWIASGALDRRRAARTAGALAPPLLVQAAIAAWQLRDPVFRATSGGLFGDIVSAPFWYPVAWGALLVLALRGARNWIAAAHPWRVPVLSWIGAVALLHSSPILNGYHFLPYAHLPVALLAAGPAARALGRLRAGAPPALALAALLFVGTAAEVAGAWTEAEKNAMQADYDAALRALGALPAGNVLCEAGFGNAVPAYGPHRVFVGHWFMTPGRDARAQLVARALGPGGAGTARSLVESEAIDYVVAVNPAMPGLSAALADLSPRVETYGSVSILRLRGR